MEKTIVNKCILNLQGVKYSYTKDSIILNNLNFKIHNGEKVGLFAPNGSGKTTLFYIIMGLIKPISGKIEIFGKERKHEKDFFEVREKVGLLFQDSDDQLFCPTVIEDVAFGPLNLLKSRDEAIKIARKTLKFLKIEYLEERVTYKLSGGEKRMVSLATILAMEPSILLLDEPSSGLDDGVKNRLINILNKLETSLVIVSHEFDFLLKTTQKIFTMKNGSIIFDPKLYLHTHKHIHQMGEQPHEH